MWIRFYEGKDAQHIVNVRHCESICRIGKKIEINLALTGGSGYSFTYESESRAEEIFEKLSESVDRETRLFDIP